MTATKQSIRWAVDGLTCKNLSIGGRRAVINIEFRAPLTDKLDAERSERRRAVSAEVRAAAEGVDGMAEYRRLSKSLRDQQAEVTAIERDKAKLTEEHEAAILAGDAESVMRAERRLAESADAAGLLYQRLRVLRDAVEQLAEELDLKLRRVVKAAANARRLELQEELTELEASPPESVSDWLTAVFSKRDELAAADSLRDIYRDQQLAKNILATVGAAPAD